MDEIGHSETKLKGMTGTLALICVLGAAFLSPSMPVEVAFSGWLALCSLALVLNVCRISGGFAVDGSVAILAGWAAASPSDARIIIAVALLAIGIRLLMADYSRQLYLDAWTISAALLVSVAHYSYLNDEFWVRVLIIVLTFVTIQLPICEALFYAADHPDVLHLRPIMQNLRAVRLCHAAVVLTVAILCKQQNLVVLGLIPLLLYAQSTTKSFLNRHKRPDANATRAIAQAHRQRADVKEKLDQTEKKRRLLEGLSEQLASEPKPQEVFHAVAITLRALVQYDKLVFLEEGQGEGYLPLWSLDKEAGLFEALNLSGKSLPVVEKAKSSRKPIQRVSVELNRVGDRTSIAVPLSPTRTLYMGRVKKEAFSPKEIESLNWVAKKIGLALELAYKIESRDTASRKASQTNYRLRNQEKLLSLLQYGVQKMGSIVDPEDLKAHIQSFLTNTISHDKGLLVLYGQPTTWTNCEDPAVFSKGAAEALDRFSESKPLVFGDFTRNGKLETVAPGTRSLLYTPLITPTDRIGFIVLVAKESGKFSIEHRDLLSTIASQSALAIANTENYQKFVSTQARLTKVNAQLEQTSKMGALGQLASSLALEITTPLESASKEIATAETKLEQERYAVARQRLQCAKIAIGRVSELISHLLIHKSKFKEGLLQKIDLSQLVENTLELLGETLVQRSTKVVARLGQDVQTFGRPEELQAVLTNMFLCALCPESPADFGVSTRAVRDEAEVVLRTKPPNSGTGFPQLVKPSTAAQEISLGPGFSVSNQIIESHSGQLIIETGEQGELIIALRLPLAEANEKRLTGA